MKKVGVMLDLGLVSALGTIPANAGPELVAGVNYYVPGDDDTWDDAAGLELQVRFWGQKNWGVAAAWGSENWRNNGETIVTEEDGLLIAAEIEDGDTSMMPIGASLLYRWEPCEFAHVIFDAGIRYVLVESDVDATIAVTDGNETAVATDTIDIEDGVVGRIGADVNLSLSERVAIFAGGGYQVDLIQGQAEAFDEEIGDNELEAFFVRAGVEVSF